MKNILSFILIMFFMLNLNAQVDRVVFWVHGLGGDDAAWSKVAQATTYTTSNNVSGYPVRKIYSSQLGYENQQYSFDGAATYLEVKIRNQDFLSNTFGIQNFDRNFIIAHSLGGLVSRSLDKLYSENPAFPRRIGGLVTFGSSHQGAKILNNVDKFSGFIGSGCNDLIAGPVEEGIETNFNLDLILSGERVREILAPICELFSGIAPLAFSDFTQPITEDMKVGSTALTQLNSFQSNIPKVAFYGIEDKNTLLWRILHNIQGVKPNAYPAFGADDDSPLISKVNLNKQKYEAKVEQWNTLYNGYSNSYCDWWAWFINPVFCAINDPLVSNWQGEAEGIRNEYQKGVNWWNGANDRFRNIIGAIDVEERLVTLPECLCQSYDYDGNVTGEWYTIGNEDGTCTTGSLFAGCSGTGNFIETTAFYTVEKPSDGIVLQESAQNLPGAISTKEMIGSNHQQMRNDNNTKDRLNELFNGLHGTYFETAVR